MSSYYRIMTLCTDAQLEAVRAIADVSFAKGWGEVSASGEPEGGRCLPVPCSESGEVQLENILGVIYPIPATHWLTSYVFSADQTMAVDEIADAAEISYVWTWHPDVDDSVLAAITSPKVRKFAINKSTILAEYNLKALETIVYV